MNRGSMKSGLYYATHLTGSNKDRKDIEDFYVQDSKGQGLSNYLKHYSISDEADGIMRTYIVRYVKNDEMVAYFSLKAGLVSMNEIETEDGIMFDTLPAVELANFAVNSQFIEKHPRLKGIGMVVFSDFIMPIILDTSNTIGIKVVYIYALPYEALINRYITYGFNRLTEKAENALHTRLKPIYDQGCIFMYQLLR